MTPLLSATLAYSAGVLAGLRWSVPLWLAAGSGAVGMILFMRAGAAAGAAARPLWRVGLLFALGGIVAGGVRGAAARGDCRSGLADGVPVVLAGVPAALPAEGTPVAFRARAVTAGQGRCAPATVRIRPHARHIAALEAAARGTGPPVQVRGRWMAYPRRGGWPAPPVYAGSVLVDSVLPAHTGARAGAVQRFRTGQQARLRALLPQRWGLAEALLLASRSGLDRETRARWVAAGLVHLLAISGMHVGLIAAGVLIACGAVGLPRRRGRRLALAVTAAYVLFLGAPTAALRAMLQAGLLLGSLELQRPAEPFTVLAAAALVILLLDPLAVLDPGFQLSFAGMAGLIAWRRPAADALPAVLPRYVRDGLAAGLAASALTTPIAALHFGQAAWVGIPASIVAVPLLGITLAALLLALLGAALTGVTAGPHALPADVLLRLLELVAELGARVPGGHMNLTADTVLTLLASACVAVLVRSVLHRRAAPWEAVQPALDAPDEAHARFERRHRAARTRWLVGAAAGAAVLAWAPLLHSRDDTLRIHAVDVGQGDAFAIRTPRGRWVLVDAGPRTQRSDAGRDRVVPFLLRHGARRVEALILTHPDADHIGGAAAVLEAFDVPLVIDPGLPAGKDMFVDLLAAARRAGQRWVAGRDDVAFSIDGVEFTLLYPPRELDAPGAANDYSVVFRLDFGDFAALFLGDAPAAVEDLLVSRHGERLRADLLKVGHHGSSTSTSEDLLSAARPGVALVSAGRRNRYGHPAPVVLHRLARHRVRVLRTDELGTITVQASRGGQVRVLAR
jgi:competence protein ComEC